MTEFLLKDELPTDLILGLYATGLLINESCIHDSRAVSLACDDVLQKLSSLLNFSKSYFDIDSKGGNYSQKRMFYVLSYFDALRFLCQPLAEYVISARKEILSVKETGSCNTHLEIIQDVFKQYIKVFLHNRYTTSIQHKSCNLPSLILTYILIFELIILLQILHTTN